MIHDILAHSYNYEMIHPGFKKAFDFFKSTDLLNLPVGKIVIDSDEVFAMVSICQGIKPGESKLEAHRKYIDIQMPLSTTETMGWASTQHAMTLSQEYDEDKDIMFFEEKANDYVIVNPMEFVVFFPEDAHQPCIGIGEIKKVVVKVKI